MVNKLGFGFLRLPQKEATLDWQAIDAMVDAFMARGGTFFDTCYTYLDGMSETAIRRCVAERKPRHSFILCDKLPGYRFSSYEDCQIFFDTSLKRCGVEYFDILMLHWLNDENYAKAEKFGEFRFLREKKEEGTARQIGFSFHGDAALLDKILSAHPEVDAVLLQLNYLDWESEGIQSRKCYETALHHGKQIFVMEPVKGGTLAVLPREAEEKLRAFHPDWTPADWALRFVQSLPGVKICLSGMGDIDQVHANLRPIEPLTEKETDLLAEVAEILRGEAAVGCTGCGYCQPHCPCKIPIPQFLRLYNEIIRNPGDDWKIAPAYHRLVKTVSGPSDCIGCGACEKHCPQKLPIPGHMQAVARRFSE